MPHTPLSNINRLLRFHKIIFILIVKIFDKITYKSILVKLTFLPNSNSNASEISRLETSFKINIEYRLKLWRNRYLNQCQNIKNFKSMLISDKNKTGKTKIKKFLKLKSKSKKFKIIFFFVLNPASMQSIF